MTPTAPFTLATINVNTEDISKTAPEAAICVNGSYYQLSSLLPSTDRDRYSSTLAIFQDWPNTYPELASLASKITSGQVKAKPLVSNDATSNGAGLLAPILYPSKLLAVGANYTSHLTEMGLPIEKWTPMPFFARPPTTTMVGPGHTVLIPKSTRQFDWECELAVVIGTRLRRYSSRAEAAAAIAGYTVGLDLTCRDLIVAGRGLGTDLMRGKAQDTMAPCGPHVVPAQLVGDLDAEGKGRRISLDVNGQRMMDASTAEMVYKCDEILSLISQHVTLEPGDVVFTGSPAGSAGANGDRWLRPGDQIRAEIEGIGVLEVVVRSDDE
jgi:2,4-diketo-3-deoxy-L-fuconate hydrolase